ncbi:hypothetical protein BH10PSE14_BH10PSE14_14880 [soil metagenome]
MREQSNSRAARLHDVASLAMAGASLMLASCGGGTGSSPTPSANQAPAFTSTATATFLENGTSAVYQATATDPEGSPVSFSIGGGPDAARFTVTTAGLLSFVTPPNYDLPTDSDGDNVYQVQLVASDGRATTTLTLAVTVANSREGIAVHRVATGFINPVAVAPISDTAVLVAEKAGAIYLLDPQTGTRTFVIAVTNLGTVQSIVAARNYATTGTFFVMYASTGGVVVYRYLRNPAGPTVPDNFGPLLSIGGTPYAGGGWLGLDATGELVIATGDGGNGAQDGASRFGKLLRAPYDPTGGSGAAAIFFPISTLARGLHRPTGGTLYAGGLLLPDSGQDVSEEVDYFPAAATSANFGWPFREGTHALAGTPPADLIDPVIEYPHGTGPRAGQAIVGGAVGGAAIASLRDQYIFADRGGAIFTVPTSSIRQGSTLAAAAIERRDLDFAPDQGAITRPVAITPGTNGAIYIVDDGGSIYRVDAG